MGLEWVYSISDSGDQWAAGKWSIVVMSTGMFAVQWSGAIKCGFHSLADAKDWCEQQEQAAQQPAELPKPGSVWGVPDKPDTWRRVMGVPCGIVQYFPLNIRSGFLTDTGEDWHSWVASSGAVDLLVDRERLVAEHEEAVNDLAWLWGWARRVGVIKEETRKLSEVVQTVAASVDRDRERLERENEKLREWKASVSKAIQNAPEFAAGKWGGDKDGWGYHFEVVNYLIRSRDAARAAVSRLLAALRGIEAWRTGCTVSDAWEVQKLAREARLREEKEGGAK